MTQATIVVPPHLGQSARQAVLDAADLAGIKVISIVNTHAAAALRYIVQGVYEPSLSKKKPETVLFYDMVRPRSRHLAALAPQRPFPTPPTLPGRSLFPTPR